MAALAAMNRPEMGCAVVASYFVLFGGILSSAIVVCRLSVIRTIDESLDSSRARAEHVKAKEGELAGGIHNNSRNEQR